MLGTAVGSFLNVWSRRLLRGQPPTGRSRCEYCGHLLAPQDLVPLFSFLLLRGRCRYCRQPLSWQYPLVELGTGLVFASILLITGYEFLTAAPLLIASSALIVVFVTDLQKEVIFDQVLGVVGGGALLYRLLIRLPSADYQRLAYDLIGALGVYFFLQAIRRVTRGRGLGDGDPPLGLGAALLVGFPLLLVEVFLAFVIGGAVGASLVLARKRSLKDRIAFGPFLVIAVFATLFFGDQLWSWYLGILGL